METVTHTENIRIGVIGAGSWGTALANLLATKGFTIDLWVYEPEVRRQILETRENAIFLPGIQLSENLRPSNDLLEVIRGKNMLLVVTPSHFVRDLAGQMADHLDANTILVSASKGIENTTHLTMSGVLKDVIPGLSDNRLAILSGPSFAKEVANHVPTAVTVASRDGVAADLVQHVMATPFFRVYAHDDIIGVELGGAVKNVIAIAAGVIDGLGLGLNTRAALITRGLAEIRRLGLTLGANPRTFTGLGGMGDLLLTCTGDLSRNHTVGKKLGEGRKLKEILEGMTMVAEGVRTSKSVYNLSRKLGVDMPISHEVYYILYEDREPAIALRRLMMRDLKQELDAV
ncbi:Glycerol-3-phosphate dehydrogenase [NAD(P)+] (EC [Olavius algarvensis associated proteobacterium Delta 3]|nr:Glycerol-3-phosphate dehydrogenase [NAD(P)+] (EC [Olavius algarvensis associated proteobacterium Delta 3]CAB5130470.1 Glycerol-3-phosphate dehydrogenase [NAD(P)+] (EC [Olavius algarvensis associated proteobacterium Delta 3]